MADAILAAAEAGDVDRLGVLARARGAKLECQNPEGARPLLLAAVLCLAAPTQSAVLNATVLVSCDSAACINASWPNASLPAECDACGASATKHNPHLNNTQYYNFGCASQANLAAMVDNPSDLLYPRGVEPGDQMRRGVVYDFCGVSTPQIRHMTRGAERL